MTYDQLVTLDAIVKHGSFKAASQHLFKTQPSLSMAIKKLEEEFGIKIFNRDNYRPTLTEDGLAFYKKSLPALEKFSELQVLGKELGHGIESEINISIDAICPLGEISNIFKDFMKPHITTALNLNVDILDELHHKLINAQIDFAIGGYLQEHEDLEHIPILETKMIPVISSEFYLNTDATYDDLKEFPQIIVKSSPNATKRKILGAAKDMKQWFTTDMGIKERLITNGLGWGRLPYHQIKHLLENGSLKEIKEFSDISPISVEISLIRNKKRILGPNTKKLWEHLALISLQDKE